jgi:hypothetical protein
MPICEGLARSRMAEHSGRASALICPPKPFRMLLNQ